MLRFLEMRRTAALNMTLYTLIFFIGVLLLTGGYHSTEPRFELSQVDAFAWALLAVMALRKNLTGSWLPTSAMKAWEVFFAAIGKRPGFSLTVGIAAYIILHVWILIWRFESYHASAYDLSYVDQALWGTTRFGFLHSSIAKGGSYLGEHFSPALGLVSLIYRMSDSIYTLFIFQTVILASGSLLVYRLARLKRVSASLSVILALCYLLYQPLRAANHFDFREDNLFIPLFLGMLFAVEKKNWLGLFLLSIASWGVKENAPIFTGLVAAWLVVRKKPAQGLTLGALSVAVFLVVNLKVTPYFARGSETLAVNRLSQFGHTNAEIMSYILHHPLSFIGAILGPIFSPTMLRYFLKITAPFVWFATSAPFVAGIALLGIVMNKIVNKGALGFHYECILIPFLFYTLVTGAAKLGDRKQAQAAMLIVLSFFLFFGRSPVYSLRAHFPNAHHKMVSRELAKLPKDASITTQGALHPHLTHRKDAFLFSPTATSTDYAIFDFSSGIDRYGTPNLEGDLARVEQSGYRKIFDQDGLLIFERQK